MKSVLRARLAAVTTVIAHQIILKGSNNIKKEEQLNYLIQAYYAETNKYRGLTRGLECAYTKCKHMPHFNYAVSHLLSKQWDTLWRRAEIW